MGSQVNCASAGQEHHPAARPLGHPQLGSIDSIVARGSRLRSGSAPDDDITEASESTYWMVQDNLVNNGTAYRDSQPAGSLLILIRETDREMVLG